MDAGIGLLQRIAATKASRQLKHIRIQSAALECDAIVMLCSSLCSTRYRSLFTHSTLHTSRPILMYSLVKAHTFSMRPSKNTVK